MSVPAIATDVDRIAAARLAARKLGQAIAVLSPWPWHRTTSRGGVVSRLPKGARA